MDNSRRIIKCPECDMTVVVPTTEELPEEGPICAMGHAPVQMVVLLTQVNQG